MHLVERGQFQRFDDLHEDEAKPQFREREDRSTRGASRAASRGKSRCKPAVRTSQEHEKTQTKGDKDGQPGKAAATKSKSGEAGQPPEKSRKVAEAAPSGMAPPGASSSSSHGSPLDQHPPFQAAQRRADEREGSDGEDHDGVAEGRRCFPCGVNKQHWFSLLKFLCHKTRAM